MNIQAHSFISFNFNYQRKNNSVGAHDHTKSPYTEMNSAGPAECFRGYSKVDQHRVHCLAKSQETGEKFSGRTCSGSLLERVRLMLMTHQESKIRTKIYVRTPIHSLSDQNINRGELFDENNSCCTHQYEDSNHFDDSWLLERCDGNSVLVNEVLQTFCAQGLLHIDAMHHSNVHGDIVATLFHVVRPDISDAESMPMTHTITPSPQTFAFCISQYSVLGF